MSELSDLEKNLIENENRLTELCRRLEDHDGLAQSLKKAGGSLRTATDAIIDISASTKAATQSLTDVASSLRKTVNQLQRSNPSRTAEAVLKIEERFLEERLIIQRSITKNTAIAVVTLSAIILGFEIWRLF